MLPRLRLSFALPKDNHCRRKLFFGLYRHVGAPEGVSLFKVCHNLEEYGRELFRFFRLCDAEGISIIYCELPSNEGLGRAIRDRLMRAAGALLTHTVAEIFRTERKQPR